MAHERRIATSIAVPGNFERQLAKHVVDETAHLFHAPAGPGPQLRNAVIKHRDTMRLSTSGNPPIETGVINQDDRIGSMMAKVTIGPAGEVPKFMDVEYGVQQPHHGQL